MWLLQEQVWKDGGSFECHCRITLIILPNSLAEGHGEAVSSPVGYFRVSCFQDIRKVIGVMNSPCQCWPADRFLGGGGGGWGGNTFVLVSFTMLVDWSESLGE